MAAEQMTCAMCGKKKAWRDGFPMGHIYAECWECVWKRHVDQEHRPKRRWHLRWPLFRDPVDEKANADAALEMSRIPVGLLPEGNQPTSENPLPENRHSLTDSGGAV